MTRMQYTLLCLIIIGTFTASTSFAQPISGTSSTTGAAAVSGTGTGAATGVWGISGTSYGILGQSSNIAIGGVSSSAAGGGGAGVIGSCIECVGVVGTSTNDNAVDGFSQNLNGVYAEGGWNGVLGSTTSTNTLTGGVHGVTTGAGNGVFAENGGSGTGLFATSARGHAIIASSGTTDAIIGTAGTATGAAGIWGKARNANTYGVYSTGNLYVEAMTGNPGDAYKPGGGSWKATSDARVKKDVHAFASGLREMEKVRPVRFKYNGLGGTADTGKEYVGVIAQELEPLLPFMVSSQKHKLRESDSQATDIKEVDPSAFTYALINAVQELSKQNKAEDAALDALSQQNKELATQVKQLVEVARLACREHPSHSVCGERIASMRKPAPF